MTQEKKPTPISVDVLAMMVFRLAQGLRKAAPGNDIAEPALNYLARYGRTGTAFRGNSAFVPDDVPAGMKPSKASAGASACQPKKVPALTEQDAALLEQAASMLEGLESDERNRGNCSTAEGAGCSAHAVRRLAAGLLSYERAHGQAKQQVTCETCNDHGMIGGPSFYDPGEGGQPCPDCEERHRNGLAAGDLMAWAAEVGGNRIAENVVEMTRDDLQRLIAERTPQTAPAAVAVPDERAAFEAWAKSEDMSIGSDCDGYIHSNTAAASLAWQARAALAATPAAAPVDKSPELQGSVVDKTVNLQDAAAAPVVLPEPDECQYRMRPTWDEKHPWTDWEPCTLEFVEARRNAPVIHDWLYETQCRYTEQQVRALLAQKLAIMPKGESAAAQLRAMATNYPSGHSWDKLDAKACIRGALEIEALRALLPGVSAPAAVGASLWTPISKATPEWTDDDAVRVIALTAGHDFGGVQVHDIKASDFYLDDGGDVVGTEVTEVCTHWAYRDAFVSAPPAAPQAQADARDAAFEAVRKKFCKLQRYSFFLDEKGNVRRTPDYSGNWVEFEAVHTLFDPAAVDTAIAAQAAPGG